MKYSLVLIACVGSAAVASAIPHPSLPSHPSPAVSRRSVRNALAERNVKVQAPTSAAPKRGAATKSSFVQKVNKWTKDRAEKNAKKPRIKPTPQRAMTVRDLNVELILRALDEELATRGLEPVLEGNKKRAVENTHSKPSPVDSVIHFFGGFVGRQPEINDLD
jgi:hypothetical protein